MLIIASVLVLSFGFSSIFAGTIPPSSLPQFEDVVLRNGSTTQCMKIMDENQCPPGHEIIKECDYWRGPIKCVPCKDRFYQCNYLTSDSPWFKCYPQHCPDQGTETIVQVTQNADGTCQVDCVCNEAMGYSGSDYRNCILQKTVCGINSELKNGVCVGCSEGFHNPNEHFGRCVPAPTTSFGLTKGSSDGIFTPSTPSPSVGSSSSRPTPRHTISNEQNTRSTPDKPLQDRTGLSVSDKIWIGLGSAILLVSILLFFLCLWTKGKVTINATCCCSGTNNDQYKPVAQGTDRAGGQRKRMSGVGLNDLTQSLSPGSACNGQLNTDITCQPNQPGPSAPPGPSCPPGPPGPPAPSPQPTIPAPEQPYTGDSSDQTVNIILIFAKADENLAFEINKRLNEMMLIDGVRVKVWDFNDPSFGGSKLHLPKQFTSKSCLVLVLLTDNTMKDSECQFMTDEAVALTRFNGEPNTKTYSVRPLHTQPPNERNYGIPDGLASIIPVDWFGPNYENKLRELCIHLSDETTASNSD